MKRCCYAKQARGWATSDPRPADFDCNKGDLNPDCITDNHGNTLQGKMGTATTVTICPARCFDTCGLVYETAATVPHFGLSRAVRILCLPVFCNGCDGKHAWVYMRTLYHATVCLHATSLTMMCPSGLRVRAHAICKNAQLRMPDSAASRMESSLLNMNAKLLLKTLA